jgi:RNA recognition motif-containing protein
MEQLTDGVRDVILYPSQTDKSKTRGYAFVEYESHRAAALARRRLVPTRVYLGGQEIEKVDWAEPENEIDEDVMNKVKILFIRNLMPVTNETQIRSVFENLVNDASAVERVKKAKDYAFVHFSTRASAEEAKDKSDGLELDGSAIDVSWSKPVDKQIYNARKQLTKIFTQGGDRDGGLPAIQFRGGMSGHANMGM